jgi:CheY-like chemotaxis protein
MMMGKKLYKILVILMALIVAGIFICCDLGSEMAPLTKFFIIFFGAVIGLQSSPAALTFIGMIKRVQADDPGTTQQPLSRNGVNQVKVRKILIVDNDGPSRKQLVELFASSQYEVETTTSAAYAIAKIVQKQEPIVILGDSFEEVITSADVIALMRKCNNNLQIIQVSDDSSLETLRRMSGDGAFYLATKPQNLEDNEELRSAVEGFQPAMS